MLTHVHKLIHLVVDTFEQGLETSLAPYTEKTKVTVSDRTLASVGPARPVSRSCKEDGVGLRPDADMVRPVQLTWQRTEESPCDRTLGESGRA